MWQRDIEQIKRLRESAWRRYIRYLDRHDYERAQIAHRHYLKRSKAYSEAMSSQQRRVLFVRSNV